MDGNLLEIKKLLSSPLAKNIRNIEKIRENLGMLERVKPELFKEIKPTVPELSELQQKEEQAKKKATQAYIAGYIPESTYQKGLKYGLYPDVLGEKTVGGKILETVKFPLKKLMSALYAFPRAGAAMATETAKRAKILALKKPSLKEIITTPQTSPKVYWEGLKAFFNMPGEYQDYTWGKAFKEMFPGTKFTKPFELAKDWEQGNRWQKFLSGLGGSPADIVGLAADILLDPITYLSGGLATGARTGIKLPFQLFAKGGKAILPKGAVLGLTKVGRKALKPAVELAVESSMKSLLKSGGVKAGTAMFEITKRGVTRKILLESLEQTVKNLPYEQAIKFIDFGGLKFMGKTVVPGYKFARLTAPVVKAAEKTRTINALESMFWTGKGIPEELRPIKHLVESQMRYRGREGVELLTDIFKGLSKTEMDDLGRYIWISSDISRLRDAGKIVPAKLKNTLDDIFKKLNPKQLAVAKDYQKRFAKDFLYEFEKGLGIKYKPLTEYYPTRYMAEPTGYRKFDIGPEVAAFEKGKKLSYLQAQKLIKEGKKVPKGLYEASLKRLVESTSRSGQAMLLQEVKQFGAPFKTKGMVNVGKQLKGLKGWYLPEEMIKPLTRMNKAFYGDDAVRYTMGLIDKGVSVWKKTALFTPGYHFRNFWTDTISGMMEYGPKFMNPKYWDEAIKIKLQKHVPIKSLGGMFGDDAAKMMLKSGEMQAGMYAVEAGRGAMKGIAKWTPFQLSRRAGVFREDMGRVVASIIEREAGSSTVTAAEQVAKVFFNYQDITPFERQFMRRAAIPFYTWYRKNITRQAELLFTRTGAYAAIPKVANFVEGMTKIPDGYMEYRPEYFADLFAIMTPFKTQDGIPLALNPNFAWQDWSRLSPRDFASSLNPLLRIPIELLGNREVFFNTPISQGKLVEAPRALNFMKKLPKDIYENFGMSVGKDDKLYMTDKAYYIYRQNPLFYNLARLYPAEPAPKTPYDWLSILVGIKFFPYEEDKAKQYYYQRFINSVNQKIGQQKTLGYPTPTVTEMESAYREMYKGEVGKKYNIEELNQLLQLLEMSGGTQRQREALSMIKQPYQEEIGKATGKDLIELTNLLKQMGIKPGMEDINKVLAMR